MLMEIRMLTITWHDVFLCNPLPKASYGIYGINISSSEYVLDIETISVQPGHFKVNVLP